MTCPSFPIDVIQSDLKVTIDALDKGEITSVGLVKEYLRRIQADDRAGKELRAIRQLVPEDELLEKAAALDETRLNGRLSLLHGIPIILKHSIGTGPEFHLLTTGGSPALVDSRPRMNSSVVDILVQAGMIVLGKASMSLLSSYVHPGIPSGWSPLGGQTISAFGPDARPGGSSTGCAVGVSAGFCGVALGAETNGSVVSPSEKAAIFGLKPTHGLISSKGVIPVCAVFDTPGLMGKSAFDIAVLLDVLAPKPTSYLHPLSSSPASIALGVGDISVFQIDDEERQLFQEASDLLRGLVKATNVYVEGHKESVELQYTTNVYKATQRDSWKEYLDGCEGVIHSLGDLIAWHDSHPEVSFHPDHPGQSYLISGLEYGPKDEESVNTARKHVQRLAASFEGILEEKRLDVVMWPKKGMPTYISTSGGFPISTVPFKLTQDGEPFGVYFIAGRNQEGKLLRIILTSQAGMRESLSCTTNSTWLVISLV